MHLSKTVVSMALVSGLLSTAPGLAETTKSLNSHGGARALDLRKEQIRNQISDQEPWLGLVGDSGISGAATSENLHASFWSLGSLIAHFIMEPTMTTQQADFQRIPMAEKFGLEVPVSPLVRVLYSQAEFDTAKQEGKVAELNLGAKGSLRLDIPEYSYGYLAGRALGFRPERIVMTAQDGQRVDSIFKQFQRFGEVSSSLPSMVIVSYSANDLCGDELDGSLEAFRDNFRKVIRREMSQVVSQLRPHPREGTKIVVMAPLDVPQLLTNPDLMKQRIRFQGRGSEGKSCGEVRFARGDAMGEQKMQETLKGMCRSVFSTKPTDTVRVQKIRDFQDVQIQVWKEELQALQGRLSSSWSLEFNDSSRKPRYQAGDLAHDCFHPGPGAHSKLALELIRSVLH